MCSSFLLFVFFGFVCYERLDVCQCIINHIQLKIRVLLRSLKLLLEHRQTHLHALNDFVFDQNCIIDVLRKHFVKAVEAMSC